MANGTKLCGKDFTVSIKLKNVHAIQYKKKPSVGINLQKYSSKYIKIYVYGFQCSIICYRKKNVYQWEIGQIY